MFKAVVRISAGAVHERRSILSPKSATVTSMSDDEGGIRRRSPSLPAVTARLGRRLLRSSKYRGLENASATQVTRWGMYRETCLVARRRGRFYHCRHRCKLRHGKGPV